MLSAFNVFDDRFFVIVDDASGQEKRIVRLSGMAEEDGKSAAVGRLHISSGGKGGTVRLGGDGAEGI